MSAKHPIIEIISDDLYDPSNEPQLDHPPSIASSSWTSGDSKLPSRYNDFDSRVLASPSFSVRFPTPIAHSCELAIDSEWSQVRNDLLSCLEQLDALLSRFSPRSTDSSQANSSSSALTFASLPPPLLAPRLVAEMLLLLHSAVVPEPAAATETPTPFQWTNAQLANRASQLESLLLQNLRVESLDALFACPVRPSGREDEPSSPYLCALPPLVRTLLAEPTCASSGALPLERNECVPAWSRTPWLLTSLVSLLSRARFPALRGAVLELALGTALNLLDVRSPSRLLALQLAQHTLAECVCAELRATGLAQALYAALTPLTFQTGDEAFQRVFVRALHSTLIDAIRVLDPFPVLPPADLMQRVSSVLSEWPHAAHDERARVDALLALVDEELRAADDATDSGSTGARAAATARTPSANAAPEQSSSVSVTRFEFCVERVLYLLRMEAKSGACEALADALLEYLQAASPQPQPPSPLSRSLAAHESGARRRPPTRPLGSVVPLAEPLLYTLEICLEHHTGSMSLVHRLLDCVDAFLRSAATRSIPLTRVFGLLCRVGMRAELYPTQRAGASAGDQIESTGDGLESRLRASFKTLHSVERSAAGERVIEPLVRALFSDAELDLAHNYALLYRCLESSKSVSGNILALDVFNYTDSKSEVGIVPRKFEK